MSTAAENEISFTLDGDLAQMATQKQFIDSRLGHIGRAMTKNDVYWTVHGTIEQIKTVLGALWAHRVEGWWHYREEMVTTYQICTDHDFSIALRTAS